MSDKQYSHHDDKTELEKALRKAQPWFERNGTTLIYAVAAVLAVAAVVVFVNRRPAADAEASGGLLLAIQPRGFMSEAGQPEQFRDVADNHPNAAVAPWARLRQAEQLVGSGMTKLYTDRKVAVEELSQARVAYEQLDQEMSLPDSLRERVLAGLARVTEATSDGSDASIDAARKSWKRVLDPGEFQTLESSTFQQLAEDRLDRLSRPDAGQFYAWFNTLTPSPDDPPPQPDGFPGGVPDMPTLTPESELPRVFVPSLNELQLPVNPFEEEANSTDTSEPTGGTATDPNPSSTGERQPEPGGPDASEGDGSDATDDGAESGDEGSASSSAPTADSAANAAPPSVADDAPGPPE